MTEKIIAIIILTIAYFLICPLFFTNKTCTYKEAFLGFVTLTILCITITIVVYVVVWAVKTLLF